jgi:elongation factor P
MKASEMKKGQAIKVEGKLYTIVDFEHVKLGKGGAVYQTKLKSIADGLIQNIRVRSEDTLEDIELQKKPPEKLTKKEKEILRKLEEQLKEVTKKVHFKGINNALYMVDNEIKTIKNIHTKQY